MSSTTIQIPASWPDQRLDLASRESHRLRNGLVSVVVLATIAVTLVFSLPGLQGVARRIGELDGGWLSVAILLELASCAGYALAFQLVFDRLPRRLASRIAYAEMAFGAVVPAGGAGGIALGAWIARAKGASLRHFMERSAVLFLLTSAINAATLGVAGLLVAAGALPAPHRMLLGLLPGGFGVVSILAFLAIPPLAGRVGAPGDERRLVRWLHATADVVRDSVRELRAPRWRLVGAVAYLWCDIAVLWASFRAFGATPPVGALILAYQIGYLSNLLPIPGGVGVLDGGIAAALILYGVPAGAAAAAVIVYHVLALWIPTLLGTTAFLRLRGTLHEPLKTSPAEVRPPAGVNSELSRQPMSLQQSSVNQA
jgi:uncharacterized membrane protein YbhN (UPF0104 family)